MNKKSRVNGKWIGVALAGLGLVSSSAFAQTEKAISSVSAENAYMADVPKAEVPPVPKTNYWPKISGRVHFDETLFFGKGKGNNFLSGAKIRRAQLTVSGNLQQDLRYSFALALPSRAYLQTAYLTYTGLEETELNVGQLYGSYGLENNGSSNDSLFLEQSLITAFHPGEVLGVSGTAAFQDTMTFSAVAFQPKHGRNDNHPSKTSGRSDRLGEIVRVTFSPVHTEETVVHLGLGGWHQDYNHTKKADGTPVPNVTFLTTPEASGRAGAALVNTGWLRAKSKNSWGVDLAGRWGPLMVQSEYQQAHVNRVVGEKNLRFYGWHLQGGYMLTGEARPYDFFGGTFKRPKPASSIGAWEIAARYSDINLNSQEVYGGKERNMSVGLNWYMNEHVRLSMNYVRAIAHPTQGIGSKASTHDAGTRPTDTKTKRSLDILAARLQVTF